MPTFTIAEIEQAINVWRNRQASEKTRRSARKRVTLLMSMAR